MAKDNVSSFLQDTFLKTVRKRLEQAETEAEAKEVMKKFHKIIYHFFPIFSYLIKCPQSLILSALRAFLLSVHVRISGHIFLCFPSQTW